MRVPGQHRVAYKPALNRASNWRLVVQALTPAIPILPLIVRIVNILNPVIEAVTTRSRYNRTQFLCQRIEVLHTINAAPVFPTSALHFRDRGRTLSCSNRPRSKKIPLHSKGNDVWSHCLHRVFRTSRLSANGIPNSDTSLPSSETQPSKHRA